MTLFVLVFSQHLGILRHCKEKGNRKMTNRPCFTPPPPNQQSDGFSLEFLLRGPQTELRTLSQNCEQTLSKNYEQTELCEQTGEKEEKHRI